MAQNDKTLQIAVLLYQVSQRLMRLVRMKYYPAYPMLRFDFVGKEIGPVTTKGKALLLAATHTLAETPSPDIVLVPGGATTPTQMLDDDTLDWLKKAHENTQWTASVCTGALILGAAGILKGLPATTHWYKMSVLKIMGAKPQPKERIVHSGKVVTAAGVSAGIDLALWLAGELTTRKEAEAIQLCIEYDPHPPFDAGHMSKRRRKCKKERNRKWMIACQPLNVVWSQKLPGDDLSISSELEITDKRLNNSASLLTSARLIHYPTSSMGRGVRMTKIATINAMSEKIAAYKNAC